MFLRLSLLLLSMVLVGTCLADNRSIKTTAAVIEQRTALVIGNSTYRNAPLLNPVHDAEDMAALLKKSGFDVDLRLNVTRRQMKKSIQALGDRLRHGGIGLFYFAGHGVQVNGINYLIPIHADIKTEADVPYEAVDANRVLSQMQQAGNRLNMVFLDACRNNPFARSFRSAGRGLAPMDAPRGSLVSFATAPGHVAADGNGRNGIYTRHLLKQMAKKNLELSRMMKQVRLGVRSDTRGQQTPFELSSLTGDFYFQGKEPAVAEKSGDEVLWQAVKDSKKAYELRLFLTEYPDSRYKGLAKLRLARLEHGAMQEPATPAAANPKPEAKQTVKNKSSLPALPVQKKTRVIEQPARLTVIAKPANARIRILNIKPVYRAGMELAAGAYHVEVTRSGYGKKEQWISLTSGEHKTVAVRLQPLAGKPERVQDTAEGNTDDQELYIVRMGKFIPLHSPKKRKSKGQQLYIIRMGKFIPVDSANFSGE
jgi:hypothetical protein